MFIRALCGAVLFYGAASAVADAADQSVAVDRASSYYPNTYYPAAVLWTGFYVGLNAGGMFGSATVTNPYSGQSVDPRGSSILGGAQVGVNWQHDSLVFGIETDFDWMSLGGSASDSAGFQTSISSHWLATVTGRIGWAMNAVLLYAKGGVAIASERDNVVAPTGAGASTGTVTQTGWTVGGGIEYAFDPHWSGRLEYDFVMIDSEHPQLGGSGAGTNGRPLSGAVINASWDISRFVAAFNYRF